MSKKDTSLSIDKGKSTLYQEDMDTRESLKTVLVIDDDKDIRGAVQDLLELEGYSVVTASNGEEGFKVLKGLTPNVILLDVRMPVMDGWEFIEVQRLDPKLSKIPLFVFCAGDKIESRPPGIEATGFLSKPIDSDDLLDSIRPYLQ